MKHTLALFLLVLTTSSVWAQPLTVDPLLLGRWKTVNPSNTAGGPDPSTAYIAIAFNENSTATYTSTCNYSSGKILNTSFTTRINVAAGKITFLDSGENEARDIDGIPGHVGWYCGINVTADTESYSISGNLLTLTDPSGTAQVFKRQ